MEEGVELKLCLVWAKMPLSEEELKEIPSTHQIRPYLLCLEKEDSFYAFPATSKFYKEISRYENEKILLRNVIDYRKSLVNLSRVYILPKENILSDEYLIEAENINEIIKKIQANFEYGNYPEEFKDFYINKQIEYSYDDLIEVKGMLFVVIGFTTDKRLILHPVYKYPVNKTVEAEVDGLKYYVDVEKISFVCSKNVDKYCTKLRGFSRGKFKDGEDNKRRLKTLFKNTRVFSKHKISNCKDYKLFFNLEAGMIIEYQFNDITYKMIIIENNGRDIEALIGNDKTPYSAFEPINLPSDITFEYEVVGVLNSKRLEDLTIKSSMKLNENNYNLKLKK